MNINARRYVFIIVVLLFGILSAFSIAFMEASDNFVSVRFSPITPEEAQAVKLIEERVVPWMKRAELFQNDKMMIAPIACFFLMLLVINPSMGWRTFKTRAGFFKTLGVAILVVSIGALTGLSVKAGMPEYLMPLFFFGLLWPVAGQEGLAGTLDTWRSGTNRWGLLRSFFMGAAFGLVLLLSVFPFRWTHFKYNFLVREVLGATGASLNYYGLVLIAGWTFFLTVMIAITLAGIIIVLSPVRMGGRNRLRWAIFPAVSALVLFSVSGAVYVNGAMKYDLGQKDIIEAAGLSTGLPEPGTLITFRPPEQEDVPWTVADERTIKVEPFRKNESDVPITMENVRRLDEFIRSRPEGSVYLSAAKYTRTQILFALWEVDEGVDSFRKATSGSIWARMVLAQRLKHAQVNEENKELLEWYMNESWNRPGVFKIPGMEHALVRMGELDKARIYLDLLCEEGLRNDHLEVLEAPPVSDGIIRGRVIVQGSQLSEDAAIALMSLISPDDGLDENDLQGYMAQLNLVTSMPLEPDGKFRFDDLGEGGYFLVVKDKSSSIPADNERVSVINSPGVLVINGTTPSIDTGEVVIRVGQ